MINHARQCLLLSVFIAVLVPISAIPMQSHASFQNEARAETEQIGFIKPLFKFGLEKITSAINRFRSIIKLTRFLATPVRQIQELEARRSVLQSVVEFLIEEIKQLESQLSRSITSRWR